MRKRKLLLISLMSLALVGCSRTTTSSDQVSSEAPVSEKQSSTSSSAKDSSSPLVSSTSTSSTVEESSSSSTYQANYSSWSNDVQAAMKKYLGGNMVPFINVAAKKNQAAEWVTTTYTDYGHLEVTGDKDLTATMISTAANDYAQAGYSIGTNTSTEFSATSEDGLIKVTLKADSVGWAYLTITYDEPYDKTKATAWDSDTQTLINDNFSGNTIPYIYLATANVTATYASDALLIKGGKWDDQVITDANTTLASATGWVVSTDSTTTSLTATYNNATSGDEITIVISKELKSGYSYYGGVEIAQMKVTMKEAWNPSKFTAWPTAVESDFNTYLDGHKLPLIYLGTVNPTSTWKTYSEYLEIDGGKWDDTNTLATIKKAFEDDNTAAGTVTSPETLWDIKESTSSYSSYPLTATKTYSDGCKIVVKLYKSYYSNITELDVYYSPKFEAPSGVTTWSTKTISAFNTYLDNHADQIPFFWIGKDDPTVYGYNRSSYSASPYVYLYGSSWNEGILTTMENALTPALGWTKISQSASHHAESSYTYVAYQKTLDDGCILTIEIEDQTNDSYQTTMYPYFYLDETFDKEKDTNTDWTKAILADFDTYYSYTPTNADGSAGTKVTNKVPYFYTGTKNPVGSYSSSDLCYKIIGGTWNDLVIDYAKAAFDADNTLTWTYESGTDSHGATLSAVSSTTSDNHYFKVELKTNSNKEVIVEIAYNKAYDATEFTNSWSSNTLTLLKTNLNNHTIPAFYMGLKTETAAYDSYYKRVTITGSIYDERIPENFKTALEADNTDDTDGSTVTNCKWNIKAATYTKKKVYNAYKQLPDSSIIRLQMQISSNNVVLYCYYDTALTSTVTDWTDAEKTTITSAFGSSDVIPYFTFGSGTNTIKASTSTDTKSITITNSGTFTNVGIQNLKDALDNDKDEDGNSKWNFKTYNPFNNEYGCKIEATKEVDGGIIFAYTYASSYSNSVSFTFIPGYKKHADLTTETTWSSKVQSAMTAQLGGVYVPYVYLGEDDSLKTYNYTNELDIIGYVYSEDMISDMKSVFEADGFECAIFYGSSGSSTKIYGSKTIEVDGETKHISIMLNSSLSYSGATCRLEIYMY